MLHCVITFYMNIFNQFVYECANDRFSIRVEERMAGRI